MWKSGEALASIAALIVLGGCAPMPPMSGPSYDVIDEVQLRGNSQSDLYQLIQKLRPYWIAKGGNNTRQNPGKIHVYLDGTRMGGLEALQMIPIAGVSYVRWYDGIAAASKWGLDHERGVIFVSTQPLEQ